MPRELSASIEFIHGPFDGHLETLATPVERMPTDIVCYVSENVFRLFEGKNRLPSCVFTSVAMYERRRRPDRWVYQFVGAVSPDKFKLRRALRTLDPNHPKPESGPN